MAIVLTQTPKVLFLFDLYFTGNDKMRVYGYIISFDGTNILFDSILKIIQSQQNKDLYSIYLHGHLNTFIYNIHDPSIKIYLGLTPKQKKGLFNFGLKLNNTIRQIKSTSELTHYQGKISTPLHGGALPTQNIYLISQNNNINICYYHLNITFDHKNLVINGTFAYNVKLPVIMNENHKIEGILINTKSIYMIDKLNLSPNPLYESHYTSGFYYPFTFKQQIPEYDRLIRSPNTSDNPIYTSID